MTIQSKVTIKNGRHVSKRRLQQDQYHIYHIYFKKNGAIFNEYVGFTACGVPNRVAKHITDKNRAPADAFRQSDEVLVMIADTTSTLKSARVLEAMKIKSCVRRGYQDRLINIQHAHL